MRPAMEGRARGDEKGAVGARDEGGLAGARAMRNRECESKIKKKACRPLCFGPFSE